MHREFCVFVKPLAIISISLFGFGNWVYAASNSYQSYSISLTASVPSDTFHVIPVDSGWVNQTQDIGYDISTRKLQVFEKQFQYKNTAGAIQATLTGNLSTDGKAQLANGSADIIPLEVMFNNVVLSRTATSVISADAAKAGGRTALRIYQADEKALNVSGLFTGSVAMVFEPVTPSIPAP